MTEHHIAPRGMYYLVFLALIIGTGLTVAAAEVDLGALNNVLMLAIACAKALLVILFFMHVRYGPRLIWIFASGGFFWLALLILLTMSDIVSRGWHIIPGR